MMKKTLILAALSSMPVLALADATTTAPVPAPNPAAQDALSSAASQNATGGYNAGVDYFAGQAYQAAAATAQSIANQDSSNAMSSFDSYGWQQAASEAQSVADQQSTLALDEAPVTQQDQSTENTGYTNELNAVPGVQQANDSAVQSSVSSGASSSLGSVTSQTGVQQGQVSMINDTSYLLAGAATQALMNGLATTGFSANETAIQDAENAASCGNPYCAAAWMAANAVEQNIADVAYAENVAAAPVLGAALDGAALTTALSDASQQLQQIQSLTGVAQGQNAGATSTAEATQSTTSSTGVTQGQTAGMVGTDTSYTSAADSQQTALNNASQQNENDAWTAAQAWQTGLDAQYAEQAATTIQQYDTSMESQGGVNIFGTSAWAQAAAIAQTAADQQASIYDTQLSIQNAATADENSAYSSANTIAPSISSTLDSAASTSASSDAQNTIQQISTATGVAQ